MNEMLVERESFTIEGVRVVFVGCAGQECGCKCGCVRVFVYACVRACMWVWEDQDGVE